MGKPTDPKKIDYILELAKTGNYSLSNILDEVEKKFDTGVSFKTVKKVLKENNITVPKATGSKQLKDLYSQKSVYLKDYTYDDFEQDVKSGKTREKIVKEIYDKNKSYYETLPKSKQTKDFKSIRNAIITALSSRFKKRPDLQQIEKDNIKKTNNYKQTALKDIQSFIKKNAAAYRKVYASNKLGAVDNFKEKVLDYASQKYPDLVTRSKGSRNLLSGQRLFEGYKNVEGKGEYAKEIQLNKDIRKVLGIKERPKKGEGLSRDRLSRTYNKNTVMLLKEAQAKGLVPKVNPITGFPINSDSSYQSFVQRTQVDPVRNLFAKKFNFGQEHLGGIARAADINDAETLTKITAMDPIQNRFSKGRLYDQKITTLVKLAKQSSPEKAKDYIKAANTLLDEASDKYGLELTKYKVVGDEIKAIQPKVSLDDSLFKKAKRAIRSFIATERFKDPAFKELPDDLKQSINSFMEGNTSLGDSFLRKAVKAGGKFSVLGLLGIGALDALTDQAEAAEPDSSLKYNPDIGAFTEIKDVDGIVAPTKVDQMGLLDWMKTNPELTVGGAATASLGSKTVRKGVSTAARGLLRAIGTPLGVGAISLGLAPEEGYDLSDPMTRIGFEAEAAFAKPLVQGSQQIARGIKNPVARRGIQAAFNLGLPAKVALRAARIATPLGLASLAAEGAYYGGKYALNEYNRIKNLSEEEKADIEEQQNIEDMTNEEYFTGA